MLCSMFNSTMLAANIIKLIFIGVVFYFVVVGNVF